MSITDPGSLNKYESFTSATYGETNFKQMAEIITELKMDKNDVFVDLGSGIGSIVMQVNTEFDPKNTVYLVRFPGK